MNSTIAISAPSPRRRPSFLTIGASGIVFRTRRRAWRPPRLPRVTIFSMSGRRSFAFGSVVWLRSWVMRDESWFRNNALRCAVVRPSFRPARLCCMESSAPRAGRGLELHAEGEALVAQDVLDLVQALAPEVLGLEHVLLGFLDELAKRPDAGVLQAVRAAHGQLELLDVRVE